MEKWGGGCSLCPAILYEEKTPASALSKILITQIVANHFIILQDMRRHSNPGTLEYEAGMLNTQKRRLKKGEVCHILHRFRVYKLIS